MATSAHAEVQALLRFLTQDAKIPLSQALPAIAALRKKNLNTPIAISQGQKEMLKEIFKDDKTCKQVENAAKRAKNPKKRTASQASSSPDTKRTRSDLGEERDQEEWLTIPLSDLSSEDLADVVVETNRAPLVLAFALAVSKYVMPDQPLSSRLSIAQAVVSANSQSRAKSIGLSIGPTAEEDGWAQGQPKMKLLGRQVAVLRRYNATPGTDEDSQETIKAEQNYETFWGLDLEAMRKSNSSLVAGKSSASLGPPIHTPQAARAYLVKSMSLASDGATCKMTTIPKKKIASSADITTTKEKAVGIVLQAIDLVCSSWASTLSKDDLDRRAWSWYLTVRPDVAQGQAGWGQKGKIRIGDILKLRKDTHG